MKKEILEQVDVKQPQPKREETNSNRKTPMRTASDEQFRKAHAKTSKIHAGLFRRLAK